MKTEHITRRILTISGLLLVVAAGVAYTLRPEVIDVHTARVSRGPMRVTVDEDGRTRVLDRFVITAPISGRLERVALREGMQITPGQIVALIAPLPLDATTGRQAEARLRTAEALASEAKAIVEQTDAAAVQARRSVERSANLLASGAVSPESHERAVLDLHMREHELAAGQSRLRAARADVDVARAALLALGGSGAGRVAVRSPTRGSVLRIPEVSERVILAGTPILELGDAGKLEVVADVLSSDATRMRVGDSVEMAAWGGDSLLHGRVRTIEPSAFTRVSALGVEEQRVNVVMDLLDSRASLGDGFRVETRTIVWKAPKVLRAPPSAVFQRGEDWVVFTVENERARLRSVNIGHRANDAVEILSGLSEGETVILFPSDKIVDGARVKASTS